MIGLYAGILAKHKQRVEDVGGVMAKPLVKGSLAAKALKEGKKRKRKSLMRQ